MERERRGQDSLLREMRQLALQTDNSGNSSPNGNNSNNTMLPSYSHTNIQSKSGRNNKR